MRYLLDTDHLSLLQRGIGDGFVNLMARMLQYSDEDYGVSVVSLHEQAIGCHAYLNRAKNSAELIRGYALLHSVLKGFSLMEVLPFDSNASQHLDRLNTLRLRVAAMDLRIASVALSRNLILLTRNVRDFGQIPSLITEDWTV